MEGRLEMRSIPGVAASDALNSPESAAVDSVTVG